MTERSGGLSRIAGRRRRHGHPITLELSRILTAVLIAAGLLASPLNRITPAGADVFTDLGVSWDGTSPLDPIVSCVPSGDCVVAVNPSPPSPAVQAGAQIVVVPRSAVFGSGNQTSSAPAVPAPPRSLGANTSVAAIACFTTTRCEAAGYRDGVVVAASSGGGVWAISRVPGIPSQPWVSTLPTEGIQLSCSTPHLCGLVAPAMINGTVQPFVSVEVNGVWRTARPLAVPGYTGEGATACWHGGCTFVAGLIDASHAAEPYGIIAEFDGARQAWQPSRSVPGIFLNAISCGAPGVCVAAGAQYTTSTPLLVGLRDGTVLWESAQSPSFLGRATGASTNPYTLSPSVGCAPTGALCVVAFTYPALKPGSSAYEETRSWVATIAHGSSASAIVRASPLPDPGTVGATVTTTQCESTRSASTCAVAGTDVPAQQIPTAWGLVPAEGTFLVVTNGAEWHRAWGDTRPTGSTTITYDGSGATTQTTVAVAIEATLTLSGVAFGTGACPAWVAMGSLDASVSSVTESPGVSGTPNSGDTWGNYIRTYECGANSTKSVKARAAAPRR